jgi:hypothetical protein
MTPRTTPAATVPLDCGSTAIVAASPMAAAAARTVSGFRRDLAPATPRAFRNTTIISRSLAPSGMWVIVDRNSFPAPETSSALVLVLSTQFPVREPSFLSVQPCTAQITPHQGDECWTSIQSPFPLKQSLTRVAVPGARPARRQSAANPRSRKARETETKSDDADETNVDAVSSEGAV